MPVITNNKTYNLIVDTGSSMLWINGNQTGKRNYFECRDCNLIQSQMSIRYGVGEVKGNVYNHDFNIINQSINLNVLQAQEIESINDLLADGLIGFNKPAQNNESFLQKIYDLNLSKVRAFGLFLNDKNCQANSVLTIGEPNKDHFYGELHYVQSLENDLWYFESGSIEIAGNNKKIMLEKYKQNMLLDSGTSKIVFPKYRFDQLFNIFNDDFDLDCEILSHNEFNELMCSYSDNFPSLVMNIGNMSLSLVSQDYVQYCSYNYFMQKKCYLNFQQVDSTNEIILGITFLQKYYTYYDGDNNKIGIAPSMNYNKDKMQLNQLGNQYNYNMLCFSLLFTAALLASIYIIVRILLKKSIPLYLSVLEKSSSRSQEQEMQTLKTSSNNQIS